METLTLEMLNEAVRTGGPASLCERIELEPAGGVEGVVAPAKYVGNSGPTYIIEKRFIAGDEEPKRVILLDSRPSQSNRLEKTISDAMKDGEGVLSKMPRIRVTYETKTTGATTFLDNELPHRAFDGHIRVGTHDGSLTSEVEEYIQARNATLENLLPLFNLSPDTVTFGGWDSTRSRNQLRIPSVFSGEVIGVLADQSNDDPVIHRAGARVDPVEASVSFEDKKDRDAIVKAAVDLSKKTADKFIKDNDGKGSTIGLGAIPPSADKDKDFDGVAISKAICIHVLSFATLRTFRFGKGKEGDEAIRALIAAVLLRAMVGYNADPVLRANCYLVETGPATMTLDRRGGNKTELEPLTIEVAEQLLQEAYDQAHAKAGITWEGQTFEVVGNPEVINNSSDEGND
ncbi:type I-G CRISPR-associated RAMP protein Csb1/Cas7g [Bifidobacterium eulemuris]|uniref:Type I-U CRISPR-associated protein Cas7 n=1 Tax=Bifidobacterium eulemuris TaxID=1765219 RepID=A0A261G244_9BIFI|nr:type I-U CRISPR-associated RAMP protein Csb1/Cas7u [Bifidobacterium eulemuris]OZG65046.1 type I-U CRISPR-associated protein Cas7 [Bifidobacterium eulemuris]QOL32863.1 type I-U CRISPR-associated protein Cas7 [Bifidobacterium eulemuris]